MIGKSTPMTSGMALWKQRMFLLTGEAGSARRGHRAQIHRHG